MKKEYGVWDNFMHEDESHHTLGLDPKDAAETFISYRRYSNDQKEKLIVTVFKRSVRLGGDQTFTFIYCDLVK